MNKILGIGNALVDVIVFLDSDDLLKTFGLPKGSMQLVNASMATQVEQATSHLRKHMASGGSSANTIHGLARLGVETAFIGNVGQDELGSFFHQDMEHSQIQPLLTTGQSPTGRAISLVSPDGERTFATYLGAAVEVSAQQITEGIVSNYNHLHLEGYLVPNRLLVETAFEMARKNNLSVSLDMASYNVVEAHNEFLHQILKRYHPIVFANEDEAWAFTGMNDPHQSLNAFAALCETAVVKIGSKGSLIAHKGNFYEAGAIQVHCIDTTGAGDLYASGFLFGLMQEYHPVQCGNIGSLLAGRVIEEAGAKISPEVWDDIKLTISKKIL
jgi:sugar/nucleoside kinase (ribokinase family)